MEPDVDPVAQAAKLPIAERTSHKNWKVREAAYRELTDKFNVAPEDSKIYTDFVASLPKIARDANAPAQLIGFEAIAKFADTAPPQLVKRVGTDVVKGIVDKGLAGRPLNKSKAIDAFLMFVGADAGDVAVEAMAATGFVHRTPKVVAASVDAITQALSTYGSSAVPLLAITSKLPPLFGHSQETVRNAAKALVIELHRWVGDKVKTVMKSAKEVTIKELEAAFAENAKLEKPQPKKLTRAMEQRVRAKEEKGGDGTDEDDGFGAGQEEEDELDLAEEIDLIEKLSKVKIEIEEGVTKDWYFALDSKKWSARKQALDSAVSIISDARLVPGPHHEIFVRLRKVLAKDSNVNVVASAAKLIIAMCHGLKKNFPSGFAKGLTVDLFGRLKEKNRVLVDSVSGALDALHEKKCLLITEFMDEITTAASHKVPKARSELLKWMGRCVRNGTAAADLKGAPLKCFGNMFVKATDDSSPEVRDAALAGLASLQKLVGDRNVAVFMEKLDKKRKEKIATIAADLPEPKKVASAKAAPAQPSVTTRSKAAKQKADAKTGKTAPKKKPSAPKRAKAPLKKPVVEESDDEGEISLKNDDILSIAAERFEGFEPDLWSGKSFKGRVAVVSTVTSALQPKETFTGDDIEFCLALLGCDPGLKDSNFMALKPKLELFSMVASKCTSPLPRKTLKPLLLIAAEKIGDLKCSKIASEMMMSFAEATSPRYLFEILSQAIQETKNSRAVVGMLKFGSTLIEDFGVPAIPGKAGAKLTSVSLGYAAPAARNAALALGCKTASRVGAEKFRKLLEEAETPPESLELFDTEMQKYSREPDPPTRKKRFGVSAQPPAEPVVVEEEVPEIAAPETPPPKVETPIVEPPEEVLEEPPAPPPKPHVRISIASEFSQSSRIFLDLKNSNWKKRQEALTAINTTLENADDFIKPNVGNEIIAALRARLSDSNRNLAAMAFTVVGRLVKAMGPGAIIHVKALVPAVLGQGCVDIKKSVREAAMKCLECWFVTVGLSPLIPYSHLPFENLNSGFRKDFLEWLIPRLRGDIGKFESHREDLAVLVDPCLVCLRDRTVEVRQLAEAALAQVVCSVGIGVVDAKVATLSKSSRLQLGPILDKIRTGDGKARGSEAGDAATPTPRSGRERPRSIATPRTPGNRKVLPFGDEETPSSGRRPRPASARMSPAVSPLITQPSPVSLPRSNEPLLKENSGHDSRSRRYMDKRRRFVEELSEAEPSSGVTPLIGEELEDLVADLRECVSSALEVKLTAPSNRFRMHVEAVQMVTGYLADNPDSLLPVSDVLLRWSACRIEDSRTPPTVLVRLAEFVSTMCEILMSSGVKLGEYEASAILPPIIEKCGSNRNTVRQAMLGGLLSIGDVVEDEVLLVLLTSCLRHPVNSRAHDEVSSEICRIIDKRCESGAGIPPGVLPTIGRVAGGHDDGAGKAAAVCLERAHEHFGDDLWNLVGDLTDDEAGLLDERLTRVISSLKPENTSPSKGEKDTLLNPHEKALADGENSPSSKPPTFPNDIRNEDFRLSVAPAPPSSVLTSISDSMRVGTPQKTKRAVGLNTAEPTPMLPSKRQSRIDGSQIVVDILERIESSERDVQLSGLASIFDDLKKDASLLKMPQGAALLPALVHCFSLTLERLEGSEALTDDPAVLKSFLKGVIRFAREPTLLRQLDQPSIEALLSDALGAMLPQAVAGVEDWDQVRRGVNLLIVRILESCDQNLLFTALINLLLGYIRVLQQQEADKTSALAKCSICLKSVTKVARRGFENCRIDALLRDLHMFLVANPVRRDGMVTVEEQTFAMRLLKSTILPIVGEIGIEIETKLGLIPQPEKSQVVHYINMTVQTMSDNELEIKNPGNAVGSGQALENESKLLGKEISEALALVDVEGKSDAGIWHLRDIIKSNPNVDIDSFLREYPDSFKMHVKMALVDLGAPKEVGVVSREVASAQSLPLPDGDGHSIVASQTPMSQGDMDISAEDHRAGRASQSHSTGQVYLERLHDIQLRYGLQTVSRPAGDGFAGPSAVEKENGAAERLPSAEETRGKASYLRERMARIRELQNASKE